MAHRHARRQPSYVGYTAAWGTWMDDLVSWRSRPRAASTESTTPMVEVDYSAKERRRWTRCVCASFLLTLVVNVFSTTFVFVRLQSAGGFTEDALVQEFLEQDGSSEVLQHVKQWSAHNPDAGSKNGTSPHADAAPDSIHMILDPTSNITDIKCGADSTYRPVTGWKPLTSKFMRQHKITTRSLGGSLVSDLVIEEEGVYQIYSQLSFDSSYDGLNTTLNYRQALMDEHRKILLEDKETKMCRASANLHIPCHVSSMFAALYLEANTVIHIEASPVNCTVRNDPLVSFFGVFKLV